MRLPNDQRARLFSAWDGWWVSPPSRPGETVTCLGPFPWSSWDLALRLAVALTVSARAAEVTAAHRRAIWSPDRAPRPGLPPPRRRWFLGTRPPR